ncbi:Diaminopimelate epimerase-like protein [Daldinia caldariorum]|uniref:Diaminopimelate epimerase-like protein n=1 Tax=Daldinia caldariorum TaxID=326644 RepID=UPI002008AFB4|nr:Diaminopimelate epimerase-like protein [Daldinia caldariorum]KAI1468860.1 Diaminopimelate epimerase-like protein [Daldinia caldariorum]
MELQFVTLDVFTSTRLQGNPLAVVTVPASLKDALPHATKQKIAQEFNLSETVFLHEPPESELGAESPERHIDIFTAEREIPFAGHPTIGAAVLARYHLHPRAHTHTLVTKAGPIGLVAQPGNRIRAKIPHDTHLHARTLADVLGATGAEGVGLARDPEIRAAELAAPVFSVVKGMTFVLVRLASLEQLAKVSTSWRLDFDAVPLTRLRDEGPWGEGGLVMRYYYVDMGVGVGEGEEEGTRDIRARMVEPGFEDPATGSAASALAAYLSLKGEGGEEKEKEGRKFRVTQGVEMGRKSDISVETTTRRGADGSVELVDLWLGGTAVVVMKGSLTVDI